jgi:hypothetical protein
MMMLLRFHKYVIMERLKKIVCLCFTILCLWPGKVLAEGNEEKAQEGRFDWTPVMEAIIKVESNGNRLARCGQSVGVMQITPILVAECNQILKKLKKNGKYRLVDRLSVSKSKEMFLLIQAIHNPMNDVEKAIRSWNGGMKYSVRRTQRYFEKVKKAMKMTE